MIALNFSFVTFCRTNAKSERTFLKNKVAFTSPSRSSKHLSQDAQRLSSELWIVGIFWKYNIIKNNLLLLFFRLYVESQRNNTLTRDQHKISVFLILEIRPCVRKFISNKLVYWSASQRPKRNYKQAL